MSDPASISREAKTVHAGFKELLKSREPFDKELDFQRKILRRKYLGLLLVHPYAPESKDAETHLWMQTSYSLISAYKQQIASLDKDKTANYPPQSQGANSRAAAGPVEYRKVLQRFRQFLADEERFWIQFVARLRRSFALQDADNSLIALGILATDNEGKIIEEVDQPGNGRNHNQFPNESLTPSPATTPAEKSNRMSILSKALVCLGDIARYRELYNDSGGRPKAGHDDGGPAKRGKHRRGGSLPFGLDALARPRNYDRSRQFYEHARFIVPNDGNPSHQLAILASYDKDPFNSLFHYYRSLCVSQPYDTAAENLETVLNKTFQHWKSKDKSLRNLPNTAAPKLRIDVFKEKIVVLHALWRNARQKADRLAEEVANDFYSLVIDRHLPEDLIRNVIIVAQCAVYQSRLALSNRSADDKSSVVESSKLSHLLRLHSVLLFAGVDQLKEPLPTDGPSDDLAQRITAVFRRTLPALRVASQWIMANFSYLTEHQVSDKVEEEDARDNPIKKKDKLSRAISSFWRDYATFSRLLSRAFPAHRLPKPMSVFEEDIDTRGYLPLIPVIEEGKQDDQRDLVIAQTRANEVHPNELQLMRIADLLRDASALTERKDSPLAMYGKNIVKKGIEGKKGVVRQKPEPAVLEPASVSGDLNDDNLSGSDEAKTDDDPVREAFSFLNDNGPDDEDAEEDEILYPRASISPKAPVSSLRLSPDASHLRAQVHSRTQSMKIGTSQSSEGTSTTAQDLLNSLMSFGKRHTSDSIQVVPSNTKEPAPLLFGADLQQPGHSIWSTSQDEELQFSSASKNFAPSIEPTVPINAASGVRPINTTDSISLYSIHPAPHSLYESQELQRNYSLPASHGFPQPPPLSAPIYPTMPHQSTEYNAAVYYSSSHLEPHLAQTHGSAAYHSQYVPPQVFYQQPPVWGQGG